MTTSILYWRRTDLHGLERLVLDVTPAGIRANSTVLLLDDAGGYRLDHRWRLSPDWRAQSVEVERWGAQGHDELLLERDGDGWRVDDRPRPDLEGADEPDLSVTPFCNTFPIRRLMAGGEADMTLATAYIDAGAMSVQPSRQRYLRQGAGRWRYIDLGVAAGFEAELVVDDRGLVLRYEHLFERVAPP